MVKLQLSSLDNVVATVWEQKVLQARPPSCLSQSNTSFRRSGLFGVWISWEETTNCPIVIKGEPRSNWFALVFLAFLRSCKVTTGRCGFPNNETLMWTSRLLFEYFQNWVVTWFSLTCAASLLAALSASIDKTLGPDAWNICITTSCSIAISSPPPSSGLANTATTRVGMFGRGTWMM